MSGGNGNLLQHRMGCGCLIVHEPVRGNELAADVLAVQEVGDDCQAAGAHTRVRIRKPRKEWKPGALQSTLTEILVHMRRQASALEAISERLDRWENESRDP